MWFLKARAKGWPFGLWLLVGPGSGAGRDFDRGFGVLLELGLLRLLAQRTGSGTLKKEKRSLTTRSKKRRVPLSLITCNGKSLQLHDACKRRTRGGRTERGMHQLLFNY